MKWLAIALIAFTTTVSCNDKLELLISAEDISKRIQDVASKLDEEYKGQELTIIMVMKGAVCLTADLLRNMKTLTNLEFIKASSYGKRGTQRGKLKLSNLENLNIKGKHILVVDDIFDTGHTMEGIVKELRKLNPKSIKTLVLLTKKVNRKTSYRPDYSLFDVEDKFVVGYGLDFKEFYRGLTGIYAIVKSPTQNLAVS